MSTIKRKKWKPGTSTAKGVTPESWLCVDCGHNTAPGFPTRIEIDQHFDAGGKGFSITIDGNCEVYTVRPNVWLAAGMEPYGGCLCIGCLEQRLGRILTPEDFEIGHPFSSLPGTTRLLLRRGTTSLDDLIKGGA